LQATPRIVEVQPLGEIYLTAGEIQARVAELGAEIARDYEGREPVLVSSLKTSVFFLADLSRAISVPHAIDFIALAGYGGHSPQSGVRLIKDLDLAITGRDVLLVEDVVDTGLTLNYVCRTLGLREPASLAAVTFLDRPYRRLVDDLPVRYVGFTVPDEFFVGYGFDLDERYRHLPDLHLLNR
jgi:hypoxanthine phosphoribosyltransferase